MKTLKSVFDYGPSELNLYKYVAEESLSLWKEAKEKLNVTDNCKPTDGVLLVHETGDNVAEDLIELFDFEFDTEYEIGKCIKYILCNKYKLYKLMTLIRDVFYQSFSVLREREWIVNI